jgi:hypothetical protein
MKSLAQPSNKTEHFAFDTLSLGKHGVLQVDREKLHVSPEFKSQVKALKQIKKSIKFKK